MSGPSFLSRFVSDQQGAAAEFAMVLPVALLFLVGMLDAGRFLWQVNQGEKATQMGARFAVVTDPVAPELTTASYVDVTVGGVTLTQGDRIPAAALGLVACDQSSCTCTTSPCPDPLTKDDTAFTNLLDRIQAIMPVVEPENLIVEYRGSGLGYAGDPNGMEIAPLVTIRLTGLGFSPFILFGGSVSLPDFSYTLTMEDGNGDGSN